MEVVLRWKANKWEKTGIMCRIFGHIWCAGWWGREPYLQPEPGVVDNLGTHHVRLKAKCWRCNCVTHIANVHDWAKSDVLLTQYRERQARAKARKEASMSS